MPDLVYRSPVADDLPALARLVDETSRGRFFAFGELDQWKLMGLSMFWRFSLPLSVMAELDGEAVGCSITCVEDEEPLIGGTEAYSFYTGVLATVRERSIGRTIWYTIADRLKAAGFSICYTDTTASSPVETLVRAGWSKSWERANWITPEQWPGENGAPYEIKFLPVEDVSSWRPARELRHWSQRDAFLKRNYRQLTALGAYRDGKLESWIILSNYASGTSAVDFGAESRGAATALWTWMRAKRYAEPFTIAMAAPGSGEDRILRELGAEVSARSLELTYPLS